MALSDTPKEKDKARNINRAIAADTNKRWSDKQKLEAVQSWLVLGNVALVGRILGIPRITLQVWKASNWWQETVEELRMQDRIELSNKMKNIVNAAHAVVADRLANGDAVVIPKTGEIIRKPVAMKDAHRVAVDLLNQKDSLDKVHGPADHQPDNDQKLKQLAEKFAEFATKKLEQTIDKKRTVDVDVVDVQEKHNDSMAFDGHLSSSLLSDDTGRIQSLAQETEEEGSTTS